MKIVWIVILIFAIAFLIFFAGYRMGKNESMNFSYVHGVSAQETDSPTPKPRQISDRSSVSQPTATPTPYRPSYNAFNYTPVPVNNGGPRNDIIMTKPITASRRETRVDDQITFTVTIKNNASFRKNILSFCFDSSDGNFGCSWGVDLAPGQEYTTSNVGSWVHGGIKNVWVTWSQDGINYYQPLNSNTVSVNVID